MTILPIVRKVTTKIKLWDLMKLFFCGIKNEHLPRSSERKVICLLILCARATRVIRKSSEGTKDKSRIASPGDEVLWPPIFFCRMAFKRLPSSPPKGFFSGSQEKMVSSLGGIEEVFRSFDVISCGERKGNQKGEKLYKINLCQGWLDGKVSYVWITEGYIKAVENFFRYRNQLALLQPAPECDDGADDVAPDQGC